jgi:Tol biopolymer transport system component
LVIAAVHLATCLAITPSLATAGPPARLTNVINAYPNPDPDGHRVVFQSNRTGTTQLYIMNGDGTNLIQLTDEVLGAETPKWSPDGRNKRQLTDSPGYDGHASWSLDGTRIIFNSDRTTPDPGVEWNQRWHEIFSMDATGGDVRQHTRQKTICTYPSFSPDQSRIVYRKVTSTPAMSWDLTPGERNSEVFVALADGSEEHNLSNKAAFDGWPEWSPTGEWIVFASNRTGPANTGQLYLIRPDGSDLRRITSGPWSYAQPAWSTDGSALFAYQHQETVEYEFGDVVRIDLGDRGLAP